MFNPFDHPFLILVVSLLSLWTAALIGRLFAKRREQPAGNDVDEFLFVLGGTLTLLGLIIGFTFSMAVSRYDQRKMDEEQEANAIGTEYVRADLLPATDAVKLRAELKSYIDLRLLRYGPGSELQSSEIDAQTARTQADTWSAVVAAAVERPTTVTPLVVSGMNDVLNAQAYTQAAWSNRIPLAAWTLVGVISIFCNFLIGSGVRSRRRFLLLILPIALSIAFFLIADIDSPRNGVIRVRPQDLESLAKSLHSQ